MPYTFGGAASDDQVTSLPFGLGGTATLFLVYGWWRPTALNAGNGYWSIGNTLGASVDAATGEITLTSDNTSDGIYDTTTVSMAVDEWRFLAFFFTGVNTGPALTWKVWAGTIDTAPVSHALTTISAPTGNFTGSTSLYFGNLGTSAGAAFDGDLAHCGIVGSSAGAATNIFGIATSGTVTAAEEEFIYQSMVLPLWAGQFPKRLINLPNNSYHEHHRMDNPVHTVGGINMFYRTAQDDSHQSVPTAITINGATNSANGAPRAYPSHPLHNAGGYLL